MEEEDEEAIMAVKQPSIFKGGLKGYQLKGLSWLVNLYDQGINGILADEMGLGKTIQTISFLAHLAEEKDIWGPFLIVTPSSTLHNWQQEITKFCPSLKALPYWGTQKERAMIRKFWNPKHLYSPNAPFHILITSYSIAVLDEKYFHRIKWQYMILDEAQALKSASSSRWAALLRFNCRNRLLLTGTPIQNSMAELWSLLHFIMPTLFDSHDEFNEWFSKDIENHAAAQTALNEQQLSRLHLILKPFMLRRVKRDVELEIGEKVELEVPCELTMRQKKLYQGIKDKISIVELLENSLSDKNVGSLMNLVMQFRKVCNHPEIFERGDSSSPFQFQMPMPIQTERLNAQPFVASINRNPISYVLPRLVNKEGLVNIDTTFGFPSTVTYQKFWIFSEDHVQRSLNHGDSSFSFSRFCDLSPADLCQVAQASDVEKIRHNAKYYERLLQLRFYTQDSDHENTLKTNRLFIIAPLYNATYPATADFSPVLTELTTRRFDNVSLLRRFHVSTTAVLAPPVEYYCSNSRFLYQQKLIQQHAATKRVFLGIDCSGWSPSVLTDEVPDRFAPFYSKGLLSPFYQIFGSSLIRIADMSKLITDSGKLRLLDAMLAQLKKEGHRVLIYSQMTKMIDILEDFMSFRHHRYLRLDGASKLSDRRDMVEDWQTKPEIFAFLLSTKAGGLGINLTAADTVIFYDSDWNPTNDQQAMDRAHRLGQTKQVTVYRIVTKGTVEERILKRAQQKHKMQSIVIAGGNFKNAEDNAFTAKEVVSLLLDESEIEANMKKQAENKGKKKTRKAPSKQSKAPPKDKRF
eukprot:TRINITY_DN10352_c0_g1_i1.p1 TRINITY_DN10352_c0_g1~~TRINITY_DN10352_c0_g1_i1.p1  ORF type:complete len:804 (+),score=229.78 TRINITY_DN10352_c0_g1_i1:1635-4046(+)